MKWLVYIVIAISIVGCGTAKEPTIGSPLAINVQAPNTTFVKDPRKLYEERMYG